MFRPWQPMNVPVPVEPAGANPRERLRNRVYQVGALLGAPLRHVGLEPICDSI